MNDHRAIIVGVCEASRTFQSNPVVYTTYSRAKGYVPQERKPLSYILASVEVEGRRAGETDKEWEARLTARQLEVARAVNRQTGLMALTSNQFLWKTINYYLKYTGIPINFGITAFLGFLVGTAIAGQTFYNFTLENLKQFGALKAMGATNGRIVQMIMLQALIVGLLGYGMGIGLATLFGQSTKGGELAFYTPMATPAHHGRGRRVDLHPGEPGQRPEGPGTRTGGGLPWLSWVRMAHFIPFHDRSGVGTHGNR